MKCFDCNYNIAMIRGQCNTCHFKERKTRIYCDACRVWHDGDKCPQYDK